MKTYRINKLDDLEQFKDDDGYYVDGNLEVNCSLDIQKRLEVTGYIESRRYIEAGEYIEAGDYIHAGWHIKAGTFIKAGWYIQAGWYIEAGTFIQAGSESGIVAGLYITCKNTLSFGLKCFAGNCSWKEISDEDKTITCSKLIGGGVVEYGILKETGENIDDHKTQERRKGVREIKK